MKRAETILLRHFSSHSRLSFSSQTLQFDQLVQTLDFVLPLLVYVDAKQRFGKFIFNYKFI